MDYKEVKLEFTNRFEGNLIAPRAVVKVGGEEGMVAPYDMLLGALGSCLYSTFLDIMRKKKIGFEKLEMVITGEKRTEVPTTLKWVKIEASVFAPEKEIGIDQAFKLSTEYCSVYQTISHVAEMSYEVKIV
ncbi:OsmC family protein [Fusibacter bizertensis]